jgi:hypothetical protein
MPKVEVPAESVGALCSAEQATVAIRNNSFLLIDVATCLVSESIRIQQNYHEDSPDGVKLIQASNYRAYVIGALFACVAFLDAAINEVFLDAVDCLPKKARKRASKKNVASIVVANNKVASYRNGELSSNIVKNMAQMWLEQQPYKSWISQNPRFKVYLIRKDHGNNIPYWLPVLDKYQLALALNKKRPIGKRNPERKNVEILTRFRNDLTHFKPGWSVSAPGGGALRPVGREIATTRRRVESLISSDTNRPRDGYLHEKDLTASGFPHDCLSAAFASLALKSILQFDDEFSKRMDIESATTRFDLKRRLSTVPPL